MSAPAIISSGTASGGPPVGGTGTTNTIPRWTGPSTLGDSVITQSGSFIGIGTASPGAQLHIERAGGATANAEYIRLRNTTNATGSNVSFAFYTSNNAVSTGFISHTTATGPSYDTTFSNWNGSTAAEVMRIVGSTGNVGIGTASPYTRTESSTARTTALTSIAAFASMPLTVTDTTAFATGVGGGINFRGQLTSSSYTNFAAIWAARETAINSDYRGSLILATADNAGGYPVERARIDSASNLILNTANTGATIQAAGSQQGLKLPATPGNGNANTLDSYQEGTRVLSAGDLSGWTYVTATQYWTLVGRTVTLHTVFTGGTSSATGGATIATPPLLTPLRVAAGAAVNSSGTALGNGVCAVASTSSTTGTVITSNAISSSAIDKVLTVTYETAGL